MGYVKETQLPLIYFFFVPTLSTLIAKEERPSALQGVTICHNAPFIHHLLFVDDNFIFARANRNGCGKVKAILSCYERASG